MNVKTRIAGLLAVSALLLAPAAALATAPEYAPEPPVHPTHPVTPMPGPKAPLPEKAKAYGFYCRTESKKHVAGQKGTPFSQCVTGMAKLAAKTAREEKMTARAACKGLSKDHVAGQKGTAFSKCVIGAAQLKKDLAAS